MTSGCVCSSGCIMFIVWVTIIAPTAEIAEIVRRRFFQLDKNILITGSFI